MSPFQEKNNRIYTVLRTISETLLTHIVYLTTHTVAHFSLCSNYPQLLTNHINRIKYSGQVGLSNHCALMLTNFVELWKEEEIKNIS